MESIALVTAGRAVYNHDMTLQVLLSESSAGGSVGSAPLTVERGTSFLGEVTVFWEVSPEGRQDLEPISGNLTFQEVCVFMVQLCTFFMTCCVEYSPASIHY